MRVLTEQHRQTQNRARPHSSPGYSPPAPETVLPANLIPAIVGINATSGPTTGARVNCGKAGVEEFYTEPC